MFSTSGGGYRIGFHRSVIVIMEVQPLINKCKKIVFTEKIPDRPGLTSRKE